MGIISAFVGAKLYAVVSPERARSALSNISTLEQCDQHGNRYASLHWPPMIPALGVEALLEFELPIPQDMLGPFAQPVACDVRVGGFLIPSELMSKATVRLLGYEELIELADEVLDCSMMPSGGRIKDNLEQRIATNQLCAHDALLLVALERRKHVR